MTTPANAGTRRRLLGAAAAVACLVAVSAAGAAGGGAPDPSFVPGAAFDAGPSPASVAVADFDGGKGPDLAVGSCGDAGTGLNVLLNDGTGGLRAASPPPLPASTRPCSIASADLNGDGKADLTVASSGASALVLLDGDGAGHFTAAPGSPLHLGGNPVDVAAADLTGDGHADLVAPVANPAGRVTALEILLGNGTGAFTEAPGSPVPILAGRDVSVAVADLNGDGKADLAVADTELNEVLVLRGDGTGRFAAPVVAGFARKPGPLRVGDFDGNGKPDLATLETNGVAVLLNDGSGAFRAAPGSPVPIPGNDLAVADLNGDAKSDLVTADPEANAVSVEVATGGGSFRRAAFSPFTALGPQLVAAADVNGDGRVDIVSLSGETGFFPLDPPGSVALLQTASTPQAEAGRAGSGPADAVLTTRRQIVAFGADGTHAVVCEGGVPLAWSALGRRAVTFKTDINGGGCSDVAAGGGRIAYTQDYCGNTSCETVVYVAKVTGGRRKAVDDQENDCGAGPCELTGVWLSRLLGGGPLIAWNDWSVDCSADCDSDTPSYRLSGQRLLRVSGGRARGVRHDAVARPLRAVGGGRMALQDGGRVIVVGAGGATIATIAAPDVRTVALSTTTLGIAGASELRLYDPAHGTLRRSIPLGPAAALALAGMTSKLALLRGEHALVVVRLSDGKQISFSLSATAQNRLFDAQLTSAGLFYAYNLGGSSAPGRIVFEPTAKLLGRL